LLANAKLILVVTVTSLLKSANCCETWIINWRSLDSASRRVSGAARLSRDQLLLKQQGRYSFCPRNLGSRWAASSSPEAAATSSSATPLPKADSSCRSNSESAPSQPQFPRIGNEEPLYYGFIGNAGSMLGGELCHPSLFLFGCLERSGLLGTANGAPF